MPTLSAVKEKLIHYVSLIGKNTNNCQRDNIGRRIDVNNATGEKTELDLILQHSFTYLGRVIKDSVIISQPRIISSFELFIYNKGSISSP